MLAQLFSTAMILTAAARLYIVLKTLVGCSSLHITAKQCLQCRRRHHQAPKARQKGFLPKGLSVTRCSLRRTLCWELHTSAYYDLVDVMTSVLSCRRTLWISR
ncbi:hypothetical protein K439DRAFT_822901 [Ramaria rubella]|nr:hypothetical protein K439DRAFT_822901 [Ramaria rubella]